MEIELVGRDHEVGMLKSALNSHKSELIAVYGRRRVGKTFLIRQVYKYHIKFEFSGVLRSSSKKQLENFHFKLSEKRVNFDTPKSWIEAFHQLSQYINKLTTKKKKVIFIDEFPWLDSRRSGFLAAFDNFWNSYVTKRNDIVVVICGSAASYMIKNIVKSTGGLHNRISEKIQLLPFNLQETELLLQKRGCKFSRYDITLLYMAMGGIPHYLERIHKGDSVAQALDRLCFQKDGFLRTEFDNIFASLFEHHDNHASIIRVLAKVRKGLTRTDILSKVKIKSGGTLTKTLVELEESGFIEKYDSYQKSKDSLFRITDEYSQFYIKFIEKSKGVTWMSIYGKQSYKIWSGFSFETICMKHIAQIKEGLKISGINSVHGSWVMRNSDTNCQIDLLIDRDDNVINLCEMKFYNEEYKMNLSTKKDIIRKINSFTESTKTKKSVYVTFISSYGLNVNEYSNEIVQSSLTLTDLFKKL